MGERYHLEDLHKGARIFNKPDGGVDLTLCDSGQRELVGSCECGIELWGSIKSGEFID
jgi:hypothetical protein